MDKNLRSRSLLDKRFISDAQFEMIRDYHSKNIFSLRKEILFLLFASVMIFTSGAVILIYNNIDSIGHLSMLALILIVTLLCYFYSFRHSPGFSKQELVSEKPLYDHLVLAANILTGIFIAYLNYQYTIFNNHYGLVTLIPTLIYFFSAYYFDHRGALSLGITGLYACIGFSASPFGIFHGNFFEGSALGYYAIALSISFIIWCFYAEKQNIKKHFNTIYQNFAFHILSIACIANLFYSYWFFPTLILAASLYYFVMLAWSKNSVYFMSFSFIYGFIGLSIIIIKLIVFLDLGMAFIYLGPFYFGFGIIAFIKSLKKFKTKIRNERI